VSQLPPFSARSQIAGFENSDQFGPHDVTRDEMTKARRSDATDIYAHPAIVRGRAYLALERHIQCGDGVPRTRNATVVGRGSHFQEKSSSRSRSPRLQVEAAHPIFVNTVASDA
jgi:hypothetical protein